MKEKIDRRKTNTIQTQIRITMTITQHQKNYLDGKGNRSKYMQKLIDDDISKHKS